MISFDGTYRLHFERQASRDRPFANHEKACAWRIRIIDLTISRPMVRHIKPWIVYAKPSGDGLFKSSCAESLGRNICRDFKLDVAQILWIEYFPGATEPVRIASFTPHNLSGPDAGYAIQWRSARPNELEILDAFLPQTETVTFS